MNLEGHFNIIEIVRCMSFIIKLSSLLTQSNLKLLVLTICKEHLYRQLGMLILILNL